MIYLELIPILLFVLMVMIDRIHLDKLSQLVKDFEEINSGSKKTSSYCNSETTQVLNYCKKQAV